MRTTHRGANPFLREASTRMMRAVVMGCGGSMGPWQAGMAGVREMISQRQLLRVIPWVVLVPLLVAAGPAKLPAPTRAIVAEGYRVELDLNSQVLGIDVPEERGFGQQQKSEEAPISPTLEGLGGGLVSGSMLAQKAKQFDDGLYAAIELAAEDGAGRFRGKAAMLRELGQALAASQTVSPDDPTAIVLAACRLGRLSVNIPGRNDGALRATVDAFLADPLRSKPIGFYTWSTSLAAIFQQDRILQSELKGRAAIETVARALHAKAQARASYDAYLALTARLTNPLAAGELRPLAQGARPGNHLHTR
jgi:hypothetical protein